MADGRPETHFFSFPFSGPLGGVEGGCLLETLENHFTFKQFKSDMEEGDNLHSSGAAQVLNPYAERSFTRHDVLAKNGNKQSNKQRSTTITKKTSTHFTREK